MFEVLRVFHHFPGGPEDGFVALFLPELNIKVTVGEFALNEPGLPFWSVVHRVFLSLHAGR